MHLLLTKLVSSFCFSAQVRVHAFTLNDLWRWNVFAAAKCDIFVVFCRFVSCGSLALVLSFLIKWACAVAVLDMVLLRLLRRCGVEAIVEATHVIHAIAMLALSICTTVLFTLVSCAPGG